MPSECVQRQIDRLLDEAEGALSEGAWPAVAETARAVLAIDPGNEDAGAYLRMAQANMDGTSSSLVPPTNLATTSGAPMAGAVTPETFGNGRCEVVKFLGEGGRKKVYLARHVLLDRQVAFALIKTEGLHDAARERITRHAQTMGRLGSHPNLVSVYDLREHTDAQGQVQPYGRCPVEEGRCHQLLADVLRRKSDDLEAACHLDAATTLFQRHGARLYLDQALEQRALLKA